MIALKDSNYHEDHGETSLAVQESACTDHAK